MFSEKVNLLKIEIASHFGQIWPALSMWVKLINATLPQFLPLKQFVVGSVIGWEPPMV